MHRLDAFVANSIQSEYQYGSHSSLIHTSTRRMRCSPPVLYCILNCTTKTISVYVQSDQEKLVFQSDIASLSEEGLDILRDLSYVVPVDVETQAFGTVVHHVSLLKLGQK